MTFPQDASPEDSTGRLDGLTGQVDGLTGQVVGPVGHPEVDQAIAALAAAAHRPPHEQVAVFDAAHQALRHTLATIDQS